MGHQEMGAEVTCVVAAASRASQPLREVRSPFVRFAAASRGSQPLREVRSRFARFAAPSPRNQVTSQFRS